ncbi:MAG: hypothetical protein Hens3KO_13780 [Henriciella sp.]
MTYLTRFSVFAVFLLSACVDRPYASHELAISANTTQCGEEVATAIKQSRRATIAGCDWTGIDNLQAARAVQSVAVSILTTDTPIIGYKFTSVPDGAVVGTILSGMILESGATLSFSQAASMLPEADMLIQISDAAINDARSTEDALKYIDQIYPYIELSNPMTWEGAGRAQIPWTATNGSMRWGARGKAVKIDLLQQANRNRFDQMRVTLTKPNGEIFNDVVLDRSLLNNLPTLLEELRARGTRLKAGDLISLGNYGKPIVRDVAAGTYTVTYYGLSDTPISVSLKLIN